MANVLLKHLNKTYPGGYQAVRDANLEIADGEFVVLVGPSGCGKSTTLRMVAGLEEVTSGDILIGDRRVNDVAPGERDIAMVFQNYALYPHMSVYQNMAFGLKMRRTAKAEIEKRVKDAAAILSIEALLERRPRELSGGQRQRMALGRAIVREPKVFLFDEPLSNLDAKLRVQMRAEIARLHQRLKTTVIYVTHDQVEAMTLGQRIVFDGSRRDPASRRADEHLSPTGQPLRRLVHRQPSHELLRRPNRRTAPSAPPPAPRSPSTRRFPAAPQSSASARKTSCLPGEGLPLATVTLDVVEQMGHETMVYFDLAESSYVARLPADAHIQPGNRIPLAIRPNAYHLFAADDAGRRLN